MMGRKRTDCSLLERAELLAMLLPCDPPVGLHWGAVWLSLGLPMPLSTDRPMEAVRFRILKVSYAYTGALPDQAKGRKLFRSTQPKTERKLTL
jgi:hypothetical protein